MFLLFLPQSKVMSFSTTTTKKPLKFGFSSFASHPASGHPKTKQETNKQNPPPLQYILWGLQLEGHWFFLWLSSRVCISFVDMFIFLTFKLHFPSRNTTSSIIFSASHRIPPAASGNSPVSGGWDPGVKVFPGSQLHLSSVQISNSPAVHWTPLHVGACVMVNIHQQARNWFHGRVSTSRGQGKWTLSTSVYIPVDGESKYHVTVVCDLSLFNCLASYYHSSLVHFRQCYRRDVQKKSLMLGKTMRRRRRGNSDEMVGWHHQLNGHESEKIPGDGEGQGSLVYCSPWGCKESDMTEWLSGNNRRGGFFPSWEQTPLNGRCSSPVIKISGWLLMKARWEDEVQERSSHWVTNMLSISLSPLSSHPHSLVTKSPHAGFASTSSQPRLCLTLACGREGRREIDTSVLRVLW